MLGGGTQGFLRSGQAQRSTLGAAAPKHRSSIASLNCEIRGGFSLLILSVGSTQPGTRPPFVVNVESEGGAWTWPPGGPVPVGSLQPESHSLDAGWAEFLSHEVSPVIPPQPAVWPCTGSGRLGSPWGDFRTGVPRLLQVPVRQEDERMEGTRLGRFWLPQWPQGWGTDEFLS